MVKPIKPNEVRSNISDIVIKAVNDCINFYWDTEQAKIPNRAIAKIIAENSALNERQVLESILEDDDKLRGIVSIYSRSGWVVSVEDFHLIFKESAK